MWWSGTCGNSKSSILTASVCRQSAGQSAGHERRNNVSNPDVRGKLEALDREVHANLKLDPVKSVAPRVAGMNSIFITAIEVPGRLPRIPDRVQVRAASW